MPNSSLMGDVRPESAAHCPVTAFNAERQVRLEQRISELSQRIDRDNLAKKVFSDHFKGDTNPYDCIHMALSRAVGLAGLLNEIFDAGDMDERVHHALTPTHLAYTADTLKHEIQAALIVLSDFWENGGGVEAWRARQEDSAAA